MIIVWVLLFQQKYSLDQPKMVSLILYELSFSLHMLCHSTKYFFFVWI